jgi:uncharacterized protein YukE
MSEIASSKPKTSSASTRWFDIARRVLVALIMVIALVGLVVDVAQLVGVWAARGPARSAVIDVTATTTRALTTVNTGLTRVNDRVQTARQTLTQVNDDVAKLGSHIVTNSPIFTQLSQLVDTNLAPRIENARTTAATIHDAVVTVDSKLQVLNRIPGVTVPVISNEVGAVSDRVQEAQTAVQDLRVTLANMKSAVVTKGEGAITQLTSKIDAPLARIQATVNKYQATLARTQDRVTSTSNTILFWIDVLAVTLTLLLIIVALALLLLLFVCWQYVRHGRFPSLRVVKS